MVGQQIITTENMGPKGGIATEYQLFVLCPVGCGKVLIIVYVMSVRRLVPVFKGRLWNEDFTGVCPICGVVVALTPDNITEFKRAHPGGS